MSTALEVPTPRADQACGACKKQKRRCDKAVPECSLCQRAGRVCTYPDALERQPTAAEFVALRTRLSELEQLVKTPSGTSASDVTASSPAVSSRSVSDGGAARNYTSSTLPTTPSTLSGQKELEFPAELFLDIDCFTWAGLKLPDPAVSIPVVSCIPIIRSCKMLQLWFLQHKLDSRCSTFLPLSRTHVSTDSIYDRRC